MGVHELTLRNFRLFSEFVFVPDPHAVTVLISPNGTGKTSVLEAIYALATAASFRTSVASDMIRINEPIADIHGVLFHFERRVQVDLTLTRGARGTTKRMLVNGQRPGSRAELSEVLPLTVFTPEGVDLVRGGPEHRRQFLTTLLTDVDPSAAEFVERFHRVLAQRNALLRSLDPTRTSAGGEGELELWSHELSEVGELLVTRREALLGQLTPLVAQFYEQLARGEDRVELNYERSWTGPLAGALHGALRDDRYRGYTSVGPHRDDVRLLLSGRDARRQCSQGEQRSLALAWRLAGHELVKRSRGVVPLLLLDDVFSELDPQRADRLMELLPVGQTFVTTATALPAKLSPAVVVDLTAVTA